MKRNSQKIVRYIVILTFSFTIALNFAFANYAFKKKIKSVCSSYRVSVNASAMDFDSDLFSLTLESNRNNFEMVMLVGFASAGKQYPIKIALDFQMHTSPKKLVSESMYLHLKEKRWYLRQNAHLMMLFSLLLVL